MIDYRPFRNTDPPAICEIWRNHPPLRAIYRPLTPSVLEATVLSRPYFDRDGFIVATENGHPIGFAHAGFSVNSDGSGLDNHRGTTCMLMLAQPQQQGDVAAELLRRSEDYLRQRGAQNLYGGGTQSIAPYYQGLYGGATVPGVLATDQQTLEFFRQAGYVESTRRSILQRQLAGFRPPVDRLQLQLKRSMQVESRPDPPAVTWWEACTEGLADRFCFMATPRAGGPASAAAVFWDVEPLASGWGVHARGLLRLEVSPAVDREAMATYLLGEALRLMAGDGATLAEIQTVVQENALQQVLLNLGFQEVEQAVQLEKVAAL